VTCDSWNPALWPGWLSACLDKQQATQAHCYKSYTARAHSVLLTQICTTRLHNSVTTPVGQWNPPSSSRELLTHSTSACTIAASAGCNIITATLLQTSAALPATYTPLLHSLWSPALLTNNSHNMHLCTRILPAHHSFKIHVRAKPPARKWC
jgi:hypothetical protein